MGQFTEDNLQRIMINPFYVVTVADRFTTAHDSPMSEAEWVQANASLMKHIGAEKWLRQLLDVLNGYVVTAEEVDLAPPPGGDGPFGYQTYGRYNVQRRGKQKRKKRHKK